MSGARAKLLTVAGVLAAGAAAATVLASPPPALPDERTAQGLTRSLAITHVTALVGESLEPRRDVTVLIDDGRIRAIAPAASVRPEDLRTRRVLDGRGAYLAPALWDMHAHLTFFEPAVLDAFVAHGVLGVREMGGDPALLGAWRRAIAAGERAGPRIVGSGSIVEASSWLRAVRAQGALTPGMLSWRASIASEAEAEGVVDSLVDVARVPFIKLRTVESPAVFHALARAAHRRGVPLVGHAPPGIPLDVAAEGMRSIEHFVFGWPGNVPPARRDSAIATFRRTGTHFVPTRATWFAFGSTTHDDAAARLDSIAAGTLQLPVALTPAALENWRWQNLSRRGGVPEGVRETARRAPETWRLLHEAGIPLLVGSDLGVPFVAPGLAVHEELASFVRELGMTPREALRSATVLPARFLGMGDSLGVIAPGFVADLVLFGADPLGDIAGTRRIRAVVQGGRVVHGP